MARQPTKKPLTSEVVNSITRLGDQLRIARKRRRMTQTEFAERLGVSRETVRRMERGDPGIAIGVILSAAWIFGLLETALAAFAPNNDTIGQALELHRLTTTGGTKRDDDDF